MSKYLLKEYIKFACKKVLLENVLEKSETYNLLEKELDKAKTDKEKIELAKNFDMAIHIALTADHDSIAKFMSDKEMKNILGAALKDRSKMILAKLPDALRMLKHYNQKKSDETDEQLKSL